MPKIVHWNPRPRLRPRGKLSRVQLPGKRWGNFGDLLGPWIVDRICETRQLGPAVSQRQRLLTVGSIINIAAKDGDIIWGSGIHGNHLPLVKSLPALDVRAVRGPLSASLLRQSGNEVPEVYGDPGLLIPHLWSDSELGIKRGSGGTVVVPNAHDFSDAPSNALNPRGDMLSRVRLIASAELVIASSLHGIIIAEAYDVPAVLVASGSETLFKYEDYYGGTGRPLPSVASNWDVAAALPAANPITNWDPEPLLEAFPSDLWRQAK